MIYLVYIYFSIEGDILSNEKKSLLPSIMVISELRYPIQSEMSIGKNCDPFIVFRNPTKHEFKKKYGNYLSAQIMHRDNSLQYKILKSNAKLIQVVLEINGFNMTDRHSWNVIWCNDHYKPYVYDGINSYQKINHFPGSCEVTRKDKLCENIVRMQSKYGYNDFDFIPETYILPGEFLEFRERYNKYKSHKMSPYWIVKPSALSRGRGIFIVIFLNK